MKIDAKKLAERLHKESQEALSIIGAQQLKHLAEAVELLDKVTVAEQLTPMRYQVFARQIDAWLHRVAEAHAEEGGDDGTS